MDYRWTIFTVARSCKHVATGAELLRTLLPRTWVNRRYDARSIDDPGYTDTVREGFDRIADIFGAEGRDRGRSWGLFVPEAAKHLEDHP